jgi:prepilin-type N-terminal cleavage/methylation domain-containing protein
MRISSKSTSGFTLVEIMIVVSVVGLLAAIAIPNMIRSMDRGSMVTIQENLRVLEDAKEVWAMENRAGSGTVINDVNELSDYLSGGTIEQVVGENYVPNAVGEAAGAVLPADRALGNVPAGSVITIF